MLRSIQKDGTGSTLKLKEAVLGSPESTKYDEFLANLYYSLGCGDGFSSRL